MYNVNPIIHLNSLPIDSRWLYSILCVDLLLHYRYNRPLLHAIVPFSSDYVEPCKDSSLGSSPGDRREATDSQQRQGGNH
jgi:hypothetical protein